MSSFPSLQSLSAVKAAIVICTNVNVKKDLFCAPKSDDLNIAEWLLKEKGSWDGVTDSTVVNLLKDVPLPRRVLDIISFHFRSVVRDTWKWFRYLRFSFNIAHDYCVALLKASLFTSSGRLDRQAAVREMLRGGLGFGQRLALACLFLPPEDAGQLWWQADENDRIAYYEDHNIAIYSCCVQESPQISSLVFGLADAAKQVIINKDNANVMDELWTEFIEGVAKHGSDVAVKCYWQKWQPSKVHQAAVRIFCRLLRNVQRPRFHDSLYITYLTECVAEILTFLLSQMEEHHKVSILQEDIERHGEPDVLYHLLARHCEVGFWDMVRLSWSVLKESDFEALICTMAWNTMVKCDWFKYDGLYSWDYHRILQEFWKQGPTTFKRYVYGEGLEFWLWVSRLDKELIAFLLKDATLEEKLSIMFYGSPGLIHQLCVRRDTRLATDLLDCISPSQTEKRKHLLKAFDIFLLQYDAAFLCQHLMEFYNFVEDCLHFEDESTKAELRRSVLCKVSNDVVVRLLEQDKEEEVDSFLQWYLSTPEEISAFKTEFLEKCNPDVRSKLIQSQHALSTM